MKTAVQLDFDGTVTEEDISFLLLDKYANGDWRKYLAEYTAGTITVGAFSKTVFGMITADEKTLTDFVLNSPKSKPRRGLWDLMDYCNRKGIRVVIVSNGLRFYIDAILNKKSIKGVEVHAAESVFSPSGMKVRYIGPDSNEIDDGFKQVYTDMLIREGYQIVYIGDGNSDIYSARKAKYVCATGALLKLCQQEDLYWYPFEDFLDVERVVRRMDLDD
jgi:2-hydroxy-3-keto-5-methylthiopentenyl-1-phosphate phosphatase